MTPAQREKLDREQLLELLEEKEKELEASQKRGKSLRQSLKETFGAMLVVAAAAVLVSALVLPVLKIQGQSMRPVLEEGDVVVALAGMKCRRGDLVSFYYNNRLLVKRVIGLPGEWVDMDEDGRVYINQEQLEESYLQEPQGAGESDVEFPLQVPEGQLFVLGDNRAISNDSRSSAVGCVGEEEVLGRLILRVWPPGRIGAFQKERAAE